VASTSEQFVEVLEILEELNEQAQRLQRAASAAHLYLTSEGKGNTDDDDAGPHAQRA
jgi:hypothetical protein